MRGVVRQKAICWLRSAHVFHCARIGHVVDFEVPAFSTVAGNPARAVAGPR